MILLSCPFTVQPVVWWKKIKQVLAETRLPLSSNAPGHTSRRDWQTERQNRWLETVPVKTLCVFKYCIKSLYLSINFAGNTTPPRLLSFFTLSLVIFQNRGALKTLKSFDLMLLHKKNQNMGKNRVTWTIYSVIYTFYSESTKRVVHFFPPLRLDPGGTGPQIKQDNVHMKKTENIITEHASLPLLPNLQPFSYFSLLPPLILTSVFLLLPLI